ncbi:hypothetical protein LXD69_03085 [Flavobacterium sediminilitoris]|uniref:Uncharacterized protein n=1 Tax=Flavobacterium sediminilitoris TaxID=2024526 RepID=A0ABY4HP85_9FLAO|nr:MULTISPECIES: hypothetical protein [Flavobacterium]UOX34503.1 hypothetical protein LXD69_03085 [Flavobacterium sediminilitoris]
MKKTILNLEGVVALAKEQQRNVIGGKAEPCRLYIRPAGGGPGYWSVNVSLEQAQSQWNGFVYNDGSYASGYCCSSCAS